VNLLAEIQKAVFDGDESKTTDLVSKALGEGIPAQEIVDNGLVKGLQDCGAGYEAGQKFIPRDPSGRGSHEVLHEDLETLPGRRIGGGGNLGKVVLATVEGDVHDIGLELVATMLGSSGFDVVFMGADVPTEEIIATVKEERPKLLGLSALLTNTMDVMP